MSFADAVRTCLGKYATFQGRARRSEFWWWVLFTFGLGIVGSIIDSILGTRNSSGSGLVEGVVNLAVLLPTIAVGTRRLHDTGRSGWWQLLWFVLVVGWIFLIVWLCQASDGPNTYGAPAQGAGAAGGSAPPPSPDGRPPA